MRTSCLEEHFQRQVEVGFQQPIQRATLNWKSIAVALYQDRLHTNPKSQRSITPQNSTKAGRSRTLTGSSILASSCQVHINTGCVGERAITKGLHQEDVLQGAGEKSMRQDPVLFGSTVQLQHVQSGKWLSAQHTKPARLESHNVCVALTTNASAYSWWYRVNTRGKAN